MCKINQRLTFLLILYLVFGTIRAEGQALDPVANTPVVANNDFGRTYKMTPVEINVSRNDYGIGVGIGGIEITTPPSNGRAWVNDNYAIVYEPNPQYVGPDELRYQICNTSGFCGSATVSIMVDEYDYAPLAHDDHMEAFELKNLRIDVLENDEWLYDLPLRLEILRDFNNGSATILEDLSIAPNFTRPFDGTDSLMYRVCDREDDCSEAWLYVKMSHKAEVKYFIPEGFSPNGDGINDFFTIPDFEGIQNMHLEVYTRTGVLVFKQENFSNSWDGRANTGIYNGQELESGTYYYLLEVKGLEVFRGFIYLSR